MVAACVFLAKAATAAQVLEYTILKEGEPIGQEIVTIDRSGDKTEVKVETKTNVKLLFLEFNYDHKRQEIWKNGQLIAMQSKTNDDGDNHTYELDRRDDHLAIKVDGKELKADKAALPLTLWGKAVIEPQVLLSVIDAQPYKVETVSVGENHYKMEGDISRELWFAQDGFLEKVAFKRKGFLIEFLRKK